MSLLGTYVGNVAEAANVALTNTTKTDIVTATDDSLTAASVSFANNSAGTVNCFVYWYQARTTTEFLIWVGAVPTKTTLGPTDVPIRLRDGDKIRAIGDANVSVTVISMLNFALSR
jgi:hypothetical protein